MNGIIFVTYKIILKIAKLAIQV